MMVTITRDGKVIWSGKVVYGQQEAMTREEYHAELRKLAIECAIEDGDLKDAGDAEDCMFTFTEFTP